MEGLNVNIKQLRMNRLLSQSDFAKEVGISFSTINRWENGKCAPSYKALKKLQSYCVKNNIDFNIQIERN